MFLVFVVVVGCSFIHPFLPALTHCFSSQRWDDVLSHLLITLCCGGNEKIPFRLISFVLRAVRIENWMVKNESFLKYLTFILTTILMVNSHFQSRHQQNATTQISKNKKSIPSTCSIIFNDVIVSIDIHIMFKIITFFIC